MSKYRQARQINGIDLPFRDRTIAGRALADALQDYSDREDTVVLALPRGGVPVAFEIAQSLDAPLDLMLVRKLGTPGQQELAMGAIATGGARVLNDEIINALRIDNDAIEAVAAREQQELNRRQQAYRGDRPLPSMEGRCVILVDDGVATGATMRAAIAAVRQFQPSKVVVAAPVSSVDAAALLRREADDVVTLATPEPFSAIGVWYREFPQLEDDQVRTLLSRAWSPPVSSA